jgi:hypothetical protein
LAHDDVQNIETGLMRAASLDLYLKHCLPQDEAIIIIPTIMTEKILNGDIKAIKRFFQKNRILDKGMVFLVQLNRVHYSVLSWIKTRDGYFLAHHCSLGRQSSEDFIRLLTSLKSVSNELNRGFNLTQWYSSSGKGVSRSSSQGNNGTNCSGFVAFTIDMSLRLKKTCQPPIDNTIVQKYREFMAMKLIDYILRESTFTEERRTKRLKSMPKTKEMYDSTDVVDLT